MRTMSGRLGRSVDADVYNTWLTCVLGRPRHVMIWFLDKFCAHLS